MSIYTVMFTDIKDFTQKSSNMSRTELNNFLKNHEDILIPVVHHFKGRVIKTIGDSLLVTFRSSYNAFLCGLFMQNEVSKHNAKSPEKERFNIRVALNTGPVEFRKNDVFGTTVNVASRIESISEADYIYFSEAVLTDMGNNPMFQFEDTGEKEIKGIEEKIRIYRYRIDHSKADLVQFLNNIVIDRDIENTKRPEIKPVSNNQSEPGFFARNFYQIFIFLIFIGIVTGGYLYFNRETDFRILKNINISISKDNVEQAAILVKKMNDEYPYSKFTVQANKVFFEKRFSNHISRKEYKQAAILITQYENRFTWFSGNQYRKVIDKEMFLLALERGDNRIIMNNANNLLRSYPHDDDIKELLSKVEGFKFPEKVIKTEKTEIIKPDISDKIEKKDIDAAVTKESGSNEIIETAYNLDKEASSSANRKIDTYEFSVDNDIRKREFSELRKKGVSNRLIVEYYVLNLRYLTPSNYDDMSETIEFFRRLSANPEWQNIRRQSMFDLDTIYIFSFYSEIADKVLEMICDVFPEKALDLSNENRFSDKVAQRYYCLRIMERLALDEKDDLKEFHISNMLFDKNIDDLRPYNYLLRKAHDFFKSGNDKIDSVIIQKCISIIDNKIQFYTYDTKEFFKSQFLPELKAVREDFLKLSH